MYAIIRTGGKQAKVEEGDVLAIERIKDSDKVTFTPLLVVGDDGTVLSDRKQLSGAKVVAEVLGESRGEKVDVFKYKNKTGYRRHQGHRQTYTTIQVTKIETPGSKKKATKKDDKKSEKQAVKRDDKKSEKKPKKDSSDKGDAKASAKKDTKKDTAKKAGKQAAADKEA